MMSYITEAMLGSILDTCPVALADLGGGGGGGSMGSMEPPSEETLKSLRAWSYTYKMI